MIGILLTGHGRFSEGLMSSLSMIAGPQKGLSYVNFLESESTVDLEVAMSLAIEKLFTDCHEIVVACDLLGGTPFKVAATLSVKLGKISVVGGINLPCILESLFSRENCTCADELAQSMIDSDASRLVKFVMPVTTEKEDPEEGI